MTEPDEERPSLREALDEIASTARPVDLTAAVSHKARALRRRRTTASALAVVVVVGGGAYAAGRLHRADSVTQSPGAVAAHTTSASPTPSTFGWFAYTPQPSSDVTFPPSVLAIVTRTVAPPPSVSPPADSTPVRTPPPVTLTTTPADVTTGVAVTPTVTSAPPRTTTTPPPVAVTTTSGPTSPPVSTTTPPPTPTAPKPCPSFNDFEPGKSNVTVTAENKARAIAMGTALCTWAGGGQTFTIEEWVSDGGVSTGFSGLTYDIQAHITGAGAGPVDGEAWVAVYLGAPGTGPFHDGTQVVLQTKLAETLKAKIEAPGSPFDAFANG